jgi:hypothetical protein
MLRKRVGYAVMKGDQGAANTPLPTPPRQQHPSDTRLALRRSRGTSELQPGSALGRSDSGNGFGYVFYYHRRCRQRRGGDTSRAAAGGVRPVDALARDP